MNRISVACLLLAVAAAPLTGCVDGEKKIKIVEIQEPQLMKLTKVNIDGTLHDENGNPVPGVTVRVVTNHQTDIATTTREGHFLLFTRYIDGETVNFQFQGNGLNAVEAVERMPTGVDPIGLHFVVMPNNRVRFAAYDY